MLGRGKVETAVKRINQVEALSSSPGRKNLTRPVPNGMPPNLGRKIK